MKKLTILLFSLFSALIKGMNVSDEKSLIVIYDKPCQNSNEKIIDCFQVLKDNDKTLCGCVQMTMQMKSLCIHSMGQARFYEPISQKYSGVIDGSLQEFTMRAKQAGYFYLSQKKEHNIIALPGRNAAATIIGHILFSLLLPNEYPFAGVKVMQWQNKKLISKSIAHLTIRDLEEINNGKYCYDDALKILFIDHSNSNQLETNSNIKRYSSTADFSSI